MRDSRSVSTIACASVQASWTLGNCFLNILNMVDTLVGAGVYRTLSFGRARPLPEIVLLYTPYVRSATRIRCFEKRQTIPCLNDSTSVRVNRVTLTVRWPLPVYLGQRT